MTASIVVGGGRGQGPIIRIGDGSAFGSLVDADIAITGRMTAIYGRASVFS